MAKLEAKGSGIVDKTFWEDFRKGLEAAIRDQFYTQNNKPEI
jgi:hypothetical protein